MGGGCVAMQLTMLFFILSIIINTIITIVLISRNNLSHKLLREIKTGVQNMVNEVESKITLAMDLIQELEELLKQAEKIDTKILSQDSYVEKHTLEENQQASNEKDIDIQKVSIEKLNEQETLHNQRDAIVRMLSQNHSVKSIAETLNVTVEEVNIMKYKEVKKKATKKKWFKVP